MKKIYKFFTSILLISSISFAADTKEVGHMIPLPEELLNSPIQLDCGAIIMEWRGSKINRSLPNKLCSFTKEKFFLFINEQNHNYELIDVPFFYDISLIPGDDNYRSLNDEAYRFF